MSRRALPTFLCLSVTVLLFTSGCDSSAAARASASSVSDASTRPETDSSASRWDNTPKVLVPQAGSSPLLGNASIQIDISNSKEGYICASYRGSSDKIKFFVVTPDQTRYT